jgi:hypothetical protein
VICAPRQVRVARGNRLREVNTVGLLNKELYTARVHYYGGVHKTDPDGEEIRGWVESPQPPAITPERNALALLIPLVSVYHLYRTSKSEPQFRDPFVLEAESTANDILESEEAAREFSVGECSLFFSGGLSGDFATFPLPRLVPESEGKSERVWTGSMMKGRRGQLWGRSKAPLRGGQAYFSIASGFELLEYAIKHHTYEETVVPAAVGMLMMALLYENLVGSWDELLEQGQGLLAFLSQSVMEFVLSDDPRREAAESKSRMEEVKAGQGSDWIADLEREAGMEEDDEWNR